MQPCSYFNPRTHEGCGSAKALHLTAALQFQSTHPRRVRLSFLYSGEMYKIISIHAPTKGAAAAGYKILFHVHDILIHAPTKGAANHLRIAQTRQKYFNPRTHEGCGEQRRQSKLRFTDISIHAPTKGAAKIRLIKHDFINISIHAPTKGAADYQDVYDWFGIISIHAPTKGAAINGVS